MKACTPHALSTIVCFLVSFFMTWLASAQTLPSALKNKPVLSVPSHPHFEFKLALGVSNVSRSEKLDVGQTATNALLQFPIVNGIVRYHFTNVGIFEKKPHFAIQVEGLVAFFKKQTDLSFPSDLRVGAELQWLNFLNFGVGSSWSAGAGFEFEKTSQATLHESDAGYNGPLYGRSNRIYWLKLGPRLKTRYFSTWQILSLSLLRSLTATADFNSTTASLKGQLIGVDADLKFGIYRNIYLNGAYRNSSGSGTILLSESRWFAAIGASFY